jgi:hypothetical protein
LDDPISPSPVDSLYASDFLVENLNGRYSGQKLMKLVRTKITAKRPRTAASVPEI